MEGRLEQEKEFANVYPGPYDAEWGIVRNDEANAMLFRDMWHKKLCYLHRQKTWLWWRNGLWWEPDKVGIAVRCAMAVADKRRGLASKLVKGPGGTKKFVYGDDEAAEFAQQCGNRARISAMLHLAGNLAPIADSGELWDLDRWVLGVANGVVDLRTGTLRDGRQSDRITKHTETEFHRHARCPRWDQFIAEVTAGDEDLASYLQRLAGYCLTGEVREQNVVILAGDRALNGKTTFLEALAGAMGEYAAMAAPGLLSEGAFDRHPTELYDLAGRRFVYGEDLDGKRGLRLARLKMLTGATVLKARPMRGDFVQFPVHFKVVLQANELPHIGSRSYAVWRRIAVVPFKVRFFRRRDQQLGEKLKAEREGILAWAVRGCLEWQKVGLGTCAAVREASRAYKRDTDDLAAFLQDRCVVQDDASVSFPALHAEYAEWAASQGQDAMTRQALGRRMAEQGFQKVRTGPSKETGYKGLGLLKDRIRAS